MNNTNTQITSGIPTRRFNGRSPSIAYTDFACVYISWDLAGRSFDLALKHERAHIWLQHQARLANLVRELGQVDPLIWNIAADLEIAAYLYTDADDAAINAPRSLLNGGITRAHAQKFKGPYAEEFYQELLAPGDPVGGASFDDGIDWESPAPDQAEAQPPISPRELVLSAQIRSKTQMVEEETAAFRPPPPSLASAMVASLGRQRRTRVVTYRRPTRRPVDDPSVLAPGRVSRKARGHLICYIDRSGSFCPAKTAKATSLISVIVSRFRGTVKNDVVYFNSKLMTQDPGTGDGGTNYLAVANDIARHQSDLSVVVTDDDTCDPGSMPDLSRLKVIVIPVGCPRTAFAPAVRAREVSM